MIKSIFKGMVIGIANIVPGVSGGTMMVSMGIYDKLIHCITHLFSEFKKSVAFLFPIAIGMVVAVAGSAVGLSWLFEHFPPLWPGIADMPLLAALVGALFIGVGVGLGVRMGGASGGDDALAMSIEKLTGIGIQWVYLVEDLIVLTLSLSYIPLRRIAYSLLTVILSGQLIGLVAKKKPAKPEAGAEPAEEL